jgi:1,4-dihydroxy-2-naphthoate octaprenyltransferase
MFTASKIVGGILAFVAIGFLIIILVTIFIQSYYSHPINVLPTAVVIAEIEETEDTESINSDNNDVFIRDEIIHV